MPSPERVVRRVAVIEHGKHEHVADAVRRLGAVAERAGVELMDGEVELPDLAVVLGGDGTMLRALKRYLGTGVPVFGVNFGSVGFLTTVAGDDLEAGLGRAFAGEFATVELATLEVTTGEARAVAINDVVVSSTAVGRMVELEWTVGGETLGAVGCDGVICCSPTGSTAYNLSNGGPVLVWGLDALAVTFVAPHSLHARPLVVPRSRDIGIRNRTLGVDVTVLVDGHVLTTLGVDQSTRVALGERAALLALLPETTFFRRYRDTFAA